MFGVDGGIGLEMVEGARSAPSPGAESAPIVGLAGLTLIDETDDAFGETGAVIGLDAARIDGGVAPAGTD